MPRVQVNTDKATVADDVTRYMVHRGPSAPTITFSTPCLSLKSFEQGSVHSGFWLT